MIVAGTSPFLYIDLGKDKLGMTLQRRDSIGAWVDVLKDGEAVVSPVDIEKLPPSRHQLVS